MSDATLHNATQDPDDFAVSISDSVESFIVAVTEVAKGDEPDSAVPFLLLEISQLLLTGGRLGAHEDFVPDERYEPDTGPEPDVDELRERFATLLDPVDVYSEVFDPYVPRSSRSPAGSPTTWPTSSPICGTASRTTGRAGSARPCGGGSSPTCPTGDRPPRPHCVRSSRWSPTYASTSRWSNWTAWTPTATSPATRSGSPRRPERSWRRRSPGRWGCGGCEREGRAAGVPDRPPGAR